MAHANPADLWFNPVAHCFYSPGSYVYLIEFNCTSVMTAFETTRGHYDVAQPLLNIMGPHAGRWQL